MAIYHFNVSIVSRGKCHNVIAKASYINASKMENRETGEISNYSNKSDVIHTEISLPSHAPIEFKNSETLWNSVLEIEKTKNSQLARRGDFALPRELSKEENLRLAREYIENTFVKNGMCVEWAYHDKPDNPHIDFIATTRPLKENGEWGAKSKKVYDLDENGNKIFQKKDKQGRKIYKNHKEDTVDWNKKETLEYWRSEWANYCNSALEKHGYEQRIDHKSFERQGIEKIPTIHEGVHARGMEKRLRKQGKDFTSNRARINEGISRDNHLLARVKASYEVYRSNSKLIEIYDSVRNNGSISNLESQIKRLEMMKSEAVSMSKSLDFEPRAVEIFTGIIATLDKRKDLYEQKIRQIEQITVKQEQITERVPSLMDKACDFFELNQQLRAKNKELDTLRREMIYPNPDLLDNAKTIEKTDFEYKENKNKLHMLEKQRNDLSGVKGLFKFSEKQRLDDEITSKKYLIERNEKDLINLGVEDLSNALVVAKQYRNKYKDQQSRFNSNEYKQEMIREELADIESRMISILETVPDKEIKDFEKKVKELENSALGAHDQQAQLRQQMSLSSIKKEISRRKSSKEKTRLNEENYRERRSRSSSFERDM